jgi:transketolase
MKNTFISNLIKEAEVNKNIVVLTGDMGFSVFEDFQKRFPNRFYNCGIAEQNMVGVAAGLSRSGKKVIIYSIIPFITFRCLEQIRNDLCYHNLNVILVGVGTGYSYGSLGFSHHAIEDIGIMKTLPNMTILSPCDTTELKHLFEKIMHNKGPLYLRLGKQEQPILESIATEFEIGDPHILTEGKDLAIISYSDIIFNLVELRKELLKINIAPAIVSLPTIKPLKEKPIKSIFSKYKNIVIIEEQNCYGGVGEILFRINKNNTHNNNILYLCVNDTFFSVAGDANYFRKQNKMDVESLYSTIIDFMKNGTSRN